MMLPISKNVIGGIDYKVNVADSLECGTKEMYKVKVLNKVFIQLCLFSLVGVLKFCLNKHLPLLGLHTK